MFSTNNKLIENISEEFNIENNEANNIIEKLFSKISESIFNKNRFYMDKLGIISIDDNNNIILNNEDENFDESLESINLTNNNIKNIFLEKTIYKSIFKNIKDISKDDNVYIENFGTFSNDGTIKFEADNYLKNKIEKLNDNEIVEDILDELDSKIKNNKENIEIKNDETLEEVVDNKSIDDNVIGNIWKNKTYNSIDLGSMIKNLNEKENKHDEDNIKNDNNVNNTEEDNEESSKIEEDNIKSENNDYPEMKEYTKDELLNVNNFDKEDLISESSNNMEVQKDNEKSDLENNKTVYDDNNNYPEMKEYTKDELLDINNFDKKDLQDSNNINDDLKNLKNEEKLENDTISSIEELLNIKNNQKTLNTNIKKLGRKNMEKKSNNQTGLLSGIIKVACIIIFILIIGLFISIYFNSNKVVSSNNVENQKLYDIVNIYFNKISSVNLSYITSKDMYYWDIAKTLYGDATYWPLIYAYNSEKYKISNIIKKGSSISYRNIPDFNSMREIKDLNNTLSKSYIYVYPILINDKKTNHALWSLKLAAYYDLNVFKNNANMIPKETYLNILKDNNAIKTTYNEVIQYGQLSENMFLSFLDLVKDKLGIGK